MGICSYRRHLPCWICRLTQQMTASWHVQFSCSVVSDSVTPWTAARQASLSITSSQSLLKLMSFESVMPSNRLNLCHPLLLPPSIFPSIRVFSNESTLHMRWPEYSASTSVLPMNTQDWSPLGWTCLISFQSKGLLRVFSNTTVQKLACRLNQYTPTCIYDPTFIRCVCIPSLHHRPLRGIHTTVFPGKESGVTWMYKLGSGWIKHGRCYIAIKKKNRCTRCRQMNLKDILF